MQITPMHMPLVFAILLGISLCQNAVDATVEMMEHIGKKHAVTNELEKEFLEDVNNYGYLVKSAWSKCTESKAISMRRLVNPCTLSVFFGDMVSKSGLPLENVQLSKSTSLLSMMKGLDSGSPVFFLSSTSHVPKIVYKEEGNRVVVHLSTYHKVYESDNYPSISKELVVNIQKTMTLLLVMLDICAGTTRAREVLTKTPLTLEQSYGATHDIFRLSFDLCFETERPCFKKFQDAIKDLEELPWILKEGTNSSIETSLQTTLYKADKDVIDFLKNKLGSN
eukprot:jgi/Antlo1/1666/1545